MESRVEPCENCSDLLQVYVQQGMNYYVSNFLCSSKNVESPQYSYYIYGIILFYGSIFRMIGFLLLIVA